MASRSLTSALRAARLKDVSRTCPAAHARSFSATATNGARHTFVESEDPQLNNVLTQIQEKIIFPAFLPAKQRKLIFDPTKRTFMAQNPVIIEVDGDEYRFSPLNMFQDVPNSKKVLNEALSRMKTPQDWRNLQILLSGYKTAGIKLQPHHLDKIIRVAGETGNIFQVIECVKQADSTNLRLNSEAMAIRVLAYVNNKITSSGWSLGHTKRAMKWSHMVLDLLHRPDRKNLKQLAILRSTLIRGLHLFTRACTIKIMQQAGEPLDQQFILLQDEAKLVATLWKPELQRASGELPRLAKLTPTAERGVNGSLYVQALAQNIKGLALARELVGDEDQTLSAAEEALGKQLDSFLAENDASGEKGWKQLADKVLNLTPDPRVKPQPKAEEAAPAPEEAEAEAEAETKAEEA